MQRRYLKYYALAIFGVLLLMVLILGIYRFAPTTIEGDPFNSPERIGYFAILIPLGLLGVAVSAAGWKIIEKDSKSKKLVFVIVPLSVVSFMVVFPPLFLVTRLFFSPLANYQQEKSYLESVQVEIQSERPVYEFVNAHTKTPQRVMAVGELFGCDEYLLLENGIVVEEYGYPLMKTTTTANGIMTEPAISEKEYTEYRAHLKTFIGKKIEVQLPSLEVFVKEYHPFNGVNIRRCFPNITPMTVDDSYLDVVSAYLTMDGVRLNSVQ